VAAPYLLVPSPLLGPASWRPVADALRRAGHDAEVLRVEEVAARGSDGDVVLVAHSNAGLRVPALVEPVGAVATVYVDAALPIGARGHTTAAPAKFRDAHRRLADEHGVLPPWTQWWDDLGDLFPDDETRAEVEAEQPRLPLSWFDEQIPVPHDWAERPSGYLAFGDTYAEEQSFARAQGWPVRVLTGRHLHQLHDPDGVGREIGELAAQIGDQVAS
jgi:hypothetical protein